MALLRIGSKGSAVKKLQVALNKNVKPSPKLKTDGVFGPHVDRAVRVYQKKKIESAMKGFDKLTDGYAKAYDAIPAMAAEMVKQAKQSHAAFLKGNQGIDGMSAKWYPISDKIIKLQDDFKAAEKKSDVARQRKLKSEIDKLHAQAEKHRTSMEASLSSVESVRKKGYEAIVSAADKVKKLMNW